MGAVLTEFINLLVGGITGMATGIGGGLQALAKGIFLDGAGTEADPYTLSVFGGVLGLFCGVSLACGLSAKIVSWVCNLGK